MSQWCSTQTGLAAPEHRKWRRIHGLQLPLHPQQLAGWLALILFAGVSFLVLVPAFAATLRPLLAAVLGALFTLHSAAHLTALLLDPADPHLRQLRPATHAVPEFDRSKHAHVIENGRCHLCNIETSGPRTKHCSVCNKCVGKFDHHCKWLNHCIGGRNYAAFLVCVVSAVGACLVIVGVSVTELVFYHVDPTWLDRPWMTDRSQEIFLIVVGSVGVLAAVTAGLLLHLCLFHVYISVLGITTYEYIRNYRQLSSVERRMEAGRSVRVDKEKCYGARTTERDTSVRDGRERCFTLSDGDLRAENGFTVGKEYLKTSPDDKVNNGADRKCRGCRYCKDSAESRAGFFSGVCGDEMSGRGRNQVRPTDARRSASLPARPARRSASLPALPPPVRRQMQSVSLKELGDVLAYVEQQRPARVRPLVGPGRRCVRRKSIPAMRPTMSPTLSPIHESGLSNPGTPQPAPKPRGVWAVERSRT